MISKLTRKLKIELVVDIENEFEYRMDAEISPTFLSVSVTSNIHLGVHIIINYASAEVQKLEGNRDNRKNFYGYRVNSARHKM